MHSIGRKKERKGIYNRRRVERRWRQAVILANLF
jgi:hypothetical protein